MNHTVSSLLYGRSLSYPPDWAAVQRTIVATRDNIRWTDSHNNTILHYSCFTKAPLDVVVFLLERHTEAVKTKNNDGWLPLHEACYHGQSIDVIQLFVEFYPGSLDVTSNAGKTPLQWAKLKNHAQIVAYLETMKADNVKAKQSEDRIMERIGAMVDNKINALEKTLKESIENILSTHTAELKTGNESTLSALKADLNTCYKKIAEMEKEISASIAKSLSTLPMEVKTGNANTLSTSCNNTTLSAQTADHNLTKKKIVNMEKILQAYVT